MKLPRHSRTQRTVPRICSLLTISTLIPMMLSSATYAATPLTIKVSNGGNYAAADAKVILGFRGPKWECSTSNSMPGSQITGSIPSNTYKGASPVKVGTIATLAFHRCFGWLGATTVKVNSLPYPLKVDSATNSKGETDLIISGIDLFLSMAGCQFNLIGSAAAYYVSGTHKLDMTPSLPIEPLNKMQLIVKNVSGCAGAPSNGDHFTIKSAYPLSIPVKISSK
jgi:hypothetical protein